MDFYQLGATSLHDLGRTNAGQLRPHVARLAEARPACVILPMLYDEMRRPALATIREGLARIEYLHELIVPLTAESDAEVEAVRKLFADMPYPVRVLWCEGPGVKGVLQDLASRGLDLRGFKGKGLAVWLGMGVASVENRAMAIHDADIESYDPTIVDRLLLPVLSPELDFFIAKGYYARITERQLYGRVVRLFVWPFLDALQATLERRSPFLSYLRSFRYPLSGEMAVEADLARNLRMPTDWGLEVGLLGEVYRNASQKRICQVDLGLYSHKHKPVGAGVDDGLQRMVVDIATAVMRLLAAQEGVVVQSEALTTLRIAYRREAQDAIRRYHADSMLNLLDYDRHQEESVAEVFERLIPVAGRTFQEAPMNDQISEWVRVISARPDAPSALRRSTMTQADAERLRSAALIG